METRTEARTRIYISVYGEFISWMFIIIYSSLNCMWLCLELTIRRCVRVYKLKWHIVQYQWQLETNMKWKARGRG